MARIRCPAHGGKGLNCSLWRDGRGQSRAKCWSRGCPERAIFAALGQRASHFRAETNHSQQRSAIARRIWNESRDPAETLVEKYLRQRGLGLALPATLRFHPALKHPSGSYYPGMVAAVTDRAGQFVTIHRTFLGADAHKAVVVPGKLALGPVGGGSVRLSDGLGEVIALAEGIETGLSILQASGILTWAVLGTSGLRTICLPDCAHEVIIAADHDEPGETAARDAAQRFLSEGRRVRIARPPKGNDFNDLLRGVA
jgi:putative DNA primase/helicase